MAYRSERTTPIVLSLAPGILARFGTFAKVGDFRIDVTLQTKFGCECIAEPFELPLFARVFKLMMRIKHERRPAEAPALSRAKGMKSNDEKSFAAETEGNFSIVRIGADSRVPSIMQPIFVMQALQLVPKCALKTQSAGVAVNARIRLHCSGARGTSWLKRLNTARFALLIAW